MSMFRERGEICPTRTLIQGQSVAHPSGIQTHLSSDVVVPAFNTSQPRSIAMIDRQSAMTDVGGWGYSERE